MTGLQGGGHGRGARRPPRALRHPARRTRPYAAPWALPPPRSARRSSTGSRSSTALRFVFRIRLAPSRQPPVCSPWLLFLNPWTYSGLGMPVVLAGMAEAARLLSGSALPLEASWPSPPSPSPPGWPSTPTARGTWSASAGSLPRSCWWRTRVSLGCDGDSGGVRRLHRQAVVAPAPAGRNPSPRAPASPWHSSPGPEEAAILGRVREWPNRAPSYAGTVCRCRSRRAPGPSPASGA